MPIETVTNTPADDSLAVRLCELERRAKLGENIAPGIVLDLIALLRQYMAHAETIERSVEGSLKVLSSAGI